MRPSLPLLLNMLGVLALLNACTTYQAKPLEDQPPLASSLEQLQIESRAFSNPASGSYEINPSDGIDLTEIAILAALNNRDLKVQRAQLQVAGAQAFAAGLLPDPTLVAGLDNPMGNAAGLVNPWLLDVGYDIVPLITRQARVDAAQEGRKKVYLELLWQEWQVIAQARSLAVRMQFQEQQLALLNAMRSLYQDRYLRSAQALEEGDITLDITGTDLTALIDTLSQASQLEQAINETRHSLNLLLGLDPQVAVTLTPLSQPADLDADSVKAGLVKLPDVRPDLLALKAGYASQEASVRAAILAQFPSIGIGINRARDSGNVNSVGLSVSLSLPFFSGNRGNIAIERATREQLRQEFAARLASAEVDVDRLLDLQAILQLQQTDLQTYLPRLEVLVDQSRHAYDQGDIDAVTFLNMESTWVTKRLEQINLAQVMWENRIALEALLALPGLPTEPITSLLDASESDP